MPGRRSCPEAGGRVGLRQGETAPGKGNLPGRRFSGNVGWSVIILADNYNRSMTVNHKGTKAQRTLKKIRNGLPALGFLRAAGSRARVSRSVVAAGRARARGRLRAGGPGAGDDATGAGLQGSDRVREQVALISVMPKGAGRGRSNFSWSEQTLNALLEGDRSSIYQRLMNNLSY
ncbi:MAG: hypothetical protein PHF80_06040 [Methanothrix sp.]|nr:hypothetical protein [Methanothrix sp.]